MSRRGRAGLLAMLAAAVAFVAGYLRCGAGWIGLNDGDGDGDGDGTVSRAPPADRSAHDAAPRVIDAMAAPCELRLDQSGLSLDGTPTTAAAAAATCASRRRAILSVAGDVRQGELERVRGALQDANVELYEPEGPNAPDTTPK